MFKKIKSYFYKSKKKDNQVIDSSLNIEDRSNYNITFKEPQKKAVLYFDQKRRVFLTKIQYSTVALFCPFKKEFYIQELDGELKTVRFNPLDDDEFAYPVVGDWTGKGNDGIGIYYPKSGLTFLKNSIDGVNKSDILINFNAKRGLIPLAGNWDGSGIDTLCFYYKKKSAFIFPKKIFKTSILRFGEKGKKYIPICGDWNNNGYDSIGLYDPKTSTFKLKYTLVGNKADMIFRFGQKNAKSIYLPLSGHWKDGVNDSIGLYEKETGIVRLRNKLSAGKADQLIKMNLKNLIPVDISVF